MSPTEFPFTPVSELAPRIASGQLRAAELLEACVGHVEQYESQLNAFVTPTLDFARRQAEARDREAREGRLRGPLHGIPVAVKDLFDVEGLPTTAGSAILKNRVASRTATAVARLLEAGAVLVGKTNLDEFARGGTSLDSFFGASLNPWNPHHTPGSSSSGSAVAVAAGMAVAALGTDTGGSVVGPAAYCNLAGIRPTYGRVSRAGVVPLGPSLDTVGPLTRTVVDAALILQAVAGPDPADPTTGTTPVPDFLAGVGAGAERLTVGVPTNYVWPGYEPEIEALVRAAVRDLESLGAKAVEVELPWADLCRPVYTAVVAAESADYHREFLRDRRDEYVSPGAGFFEQGLFVPGWRYVQAQRARTLFMRQAAGVFRTVDVIVAPTSPIAPPSFEECRKGPVVWGPISHCKRPFSLLGIPVLELPVGFTTAGLPVGMQMAGRWGEEALLFRIGVAYEAARPWWKRRPPLDDPPTSVRGFTDWARTAEPVPETTGGLSVDGVQALAKSMGHSVRPPHLEALAEDVNRMLAQLAPLDSLGLEGCPRADHLDLLALDANYFLGEAQVRYEGVEGSKGR
ncbi:MAG: amidase [Gemmatimonadetes bacterium]|nr:amidase [Gemmatimonadota bacterium]